MSKKIIKKLDIQEKKNITEEKKSDKMIRFNLPEFGIVVEAKNTEEAIEKANKIFSKK